MRIIVFLRIYVVRLIRGSFSNFTRYTFPLLAFAPALLSLRNLFAFDAANAKCVPTVISVVLRVSTTIVKVILGRLILTYLKLVHLQLSRKFFTPFPPPLRLELPLYQICSAPFEKSTRFSLTSTYTFIMRMIAFLKVISLVQDCDAKTGPRYKQASPFWPQI